MTDLNWKLHLSSQEAWDSMYADCEKAKEMIDCEMYVLTVDEIGRRFVDLFIKKAQDGVKVRLLLDMVGSYPFSPLVLKELKNGGVEVLFFNPISLWRIATFSSNYFRDHRKLLVVDYDIVHTGGVNIRDDMRTWRDTNIRLRGELAEMASHNFARMWRIVEQKKFLPFKKPAEFTDNFALYTNSPHFHQRFIYKALVKAIRGAKKYVYLTTPYFVPDIRLLRVLRHAARRGVDVQVLIPISSDYKSIDLAAQSYFTLLLKAGIKVYRYNRPSEYMLHAKTAVVDGNWSTIGSFNFSSLHSLLSYEFNVVSNSGELASRLKNIFMDDLQYAQQVLAEDWYKRPFIRKFLEALTWPIHKFL